MAEPLPPLALSMQLCQGVFVHPTTGEQTLLSLFGQVASAAFPVTLPPFVVFAELTECVGAVLLTLRVVDASEAEDPLYEAEPRLLVSADALGVAQLTFDVPGLTFGGPGECRVQLLYNGVSVTERRLYVVAFLDPENDRDRDDEPWRDPAAGPE